MIDLPAIVWLERTSSRYDPHLVVRGVGSKNDGHIPALVLTAEVLADLEAHASEYGFDKPPPWLRAALEAGNG